MRINSLTMVQKLILVRVFEMCRNEVLCLISHKRLAADMGRSRWTIIRALKGLTGSWLIVDSRQFRGRTNIYRPSARLMQYLCQQQSRAARRIPKGGG